MRLLKIEIKCFDKKRAEIMGDDDLDADIPSECVIDLDKVTSAWTDPAGAILICLDGGESYWSKTHTLSEFVKIWQGND